MPKKLYGRVVLIHGAEFRRKSRINMRRLAPAFRASGFCIVIPTYGFLPALLLGLIPWLDDRIAETLAGFITEEDILVGHSNGGTLAYLVSQRVKVRGTVLVNAALEASKIPNAEFVHVYYNSGDIITKISALLPFHPWGSMGGTGYTGVSLPHVRNIDQEHPPLADLPPLYGHSDIFKAHKTRKWARYMAELCVQSVLEIRRSKS